MSDIIGRVFNIQHFSTEDGPGIRTTVFLKGCPLRCPWCANPESQVPYPQLGHRSSKCIKCGTCIQSCPSGALHVAEGQVKIRRDLCRSCGTCVKVCPSGAMFFYGEEKTVDQVFEEVARDAGYYAQSGGGVTVSGGECMTQPEFVAALFQRCKASGFHTALDTCGYFPEKSLSSVLALTDLVLFDIKLMDREAHHKYMGVSNDLIFKNLRTIIQSRAEVFIRIPVIPGVNDAPENLTATAEFVASLGSPHVDLLPYHNYGEGKYLILDQPYPMSGTARPSREHMERCRAFFTDRGIDCTIH